MVFSLHEKRVHKNNNVGVPVFLVHEFELHVRTCPLFSPALRFMTHRAALGRQRQSREREIERERESA